MMRGTLWFLVAFLSGGGLVGGQLPRPTTWPPSDQVEEDFGRRTEDDLFRRLRVLAVPSREMSLTTFVEFLNASRLPARLDRESLRDAGIDLEETRFTWTGEIPIIDLLDQLLDQSLTWSIRSGVIVVSSPESNEKLETRLYGVRDLLETVAMGRPGQVDGKSLIALIAGTIEPDSWADYGGAGTLALYRSDESAVLVVSASFQVQRQVKTLLDRLRRLRRVGQESAVRLAPGREFGQQSSLSVLRQSELRSTTLPRQSR